MARSSSRTGKKVNVKKAIKRPGALKARTKKGESATAAARRIKKSKSASPLAKRQANFYLNVLGGGRKSGRKGSGKKKR